MSAAALAYNGFQCYGFNAGAQPIDATQFVNQKAEAYWTLRIYLQELGGHGRGPDLIRKRQI